MICMIDRYICYVGTDTMQFKESIVQPSVGPLLYISILVVFAERVTITSSLTFLDDVIRLVCHNKRKFGPKDS